VLNVAERVAHGDGIADVVPWHEGVMGDKERQED